MLCTLLGSNDHAKSYNYVRINCVFNFPVYILFEVNQLLNKILVMCVLLFS